MFKDLFTAIGGATRDLLTNWRVVVVLAALYAALLLSIYWFFAIGVATVWQLVFSAILVVVAPILFFLLQTVVVVHAAGAERTSELLRRALKEFWKILLISLPLIALGILVVYLLNKLQAQFPVPVEEARRVLPAGASARATPPPLPMRWQDVSFAALRLLLVGAVLPLVTVQLWIAVAREGLIATLKKVHRVIGRAFTPQSVLIYTVGLFVFGLMPYFLIYTTTQISNGWIELIVFGMRLLFVFLLTLAGWTVTLRALAVIIRIDEVAAAESTVAESAVSVDAGSAGVPPAVSAKREE